MWLMLPSLQMSSLPPASSHGRRQPCRGLVLWRCWSHPHSRCLWPEDGTAHNSGKVFKELSYTGGIEPCCPWEACGLRSADGEAFAPVHKIGKPVLPCQLMVIPSHAFQFSHSEVACNTNKGPCYNCPLATVAPELPYLMNTFSRYHIRTISVDMSMSDVKISLLSITGIGICPKFP